MDIVPFVRLSARHSRVVWFAVLVATGFLGYGLSRLEVETGMLDWLPRDHPHVRAFRQLFDSLNGVVNQELVWLELDPEKARALGVQSVTDHKSFLAQEELLSYLEERVPAIKGAFGILPLLKTVRSLQSGSATLEPSVPESPLQTALLWTLLRGVAADLVNSPVSQDGTGTTLALILDTTPLSRNARDVGLALQSALAAYRDDPSVTHDLFVDAYLVPAGLSSGTAVIDLSLRRDIVFLTPLAALFLVAVLRLILGTWRSVAIVAVLLGVGTVWTLGLMGWCGASLNVITIALVPLILGCGIDYAILVILEAADRRASGHSADETLEGIARGSATAITLTSLTTATGLLALVFSNSPGMAALGFHAAAGMLGLALLSTAVLPGVAVRIDSRTPSRFGPVIAPIATSFTRNRTVVLLVCFASTVAAAALAARSIFLLDVIKGNYPEDAPITRAVDRMREKCGGAFPEILIASGDLSSPESMDLLIRIEERIASSPVLGGKFRPMGLPDLLGARALLVGGKSPEVGAPTGLLTGGVRRAAPSKSREIGDAVREMYSNPTWAPLAGMFVNPDLTVGTVLLMGGDAGNDLESVGRIWAELRNIIDEEKQPGDPVDVSFLGYRTMAYLFVTHGMKWIQITAAVSLVVVAVLTALFVRSRRAILVVLALMLTSGLWWFALLQLTGIYISIFLLFPLVFAMCIGSDYGLHILCRIRAEGALGSSKISGKGVSALEKTKLVWSTTGRAIAFAAFTDAGVFLIFSNMELVSASHVMLAVALAVAAVFTCTVMLVPALAFSKDAASRFEFGETRTKDE